MKTCAVIVTYGERFKFLHRVVDGLLTQNVYKIIIIDNASSVNYQEYVIQKKKYWGDRIEVIVKKENSGSAGGYKTGIETAIRDQECEFIWLLDDDNLPNDHALAKLHNFWLSIEDENKREKCALLARRVSQPIYEEAIRSGNAELFLTKRNNFLGFHVMDSLRIFRKIFIFQNKNGKYQLPNGVISVSPYGGMFFHKDLIDIIGLPDENYFVYADDFDFSYRITRNGGKIILVSEARIEDIDDSWRSSEIKNPIIRL